METQRHPNVIERVDPEALLSDCLHAAAHMMARGSIPSEVDNWLAQSVPGLDLAGIEARMRSIAAGRSAPPEPRRHTINPLTQTVEDAASALPDICALLLNALAYTRASRVALSRYVSESVPEAPARSLLGIGLGAPGPGNHGICSDAQVPAICFGNREALARHPELLRRLHMEASTRAAICRMRSIAMEWCSAHGTLDDGARDMLSTPPIKRSMAAVTQELAVQHAGRTSCFHGTARAAALRQAIPITGLLSDELAAEVCRLSSADDALLPIQAASQSTTPLARRLGLAGSRSALNEIRWRAWCELCRLICFGDSGPAETTGPLFMTAEQAGSIVGYGLASLPSSALASTGARASASDDGPAGFLEAWCVTWELLHYSAATRVLDYRSTNPGM